MTALRTASVIALGACRLWWIIPGPFTRAGWDRSVEFCCKGRGLCVPFPGEALRAASTASGSAITTGATGAEEDDVQRRPPLARQMANVRRPGAAPDVGHPVRHRRFAARHQVRTLARHERVSSLVVSCVMDDFPCKSPPAPPHVPRSRTGNAAVRRRRAAADGPPPLSAYCRHGANGISSSNFGVMPSLPPACSRVACCSEERASSFRASRKVSVNRHRNDTRAECRPL